MSATVADYSWWRTWRPAWAEAHCVTLVSDITPECAVTSLDAISVASVQGIDALYERAVEDWPGGYDPSQAVIGVAGIDDKWALVAEINGFVGVTERLIGPMSAGRTIVSHFSNINAVHRFNWWRDGRLLVDFDLLFPTERFGADPDALLDDIRGVGIPLDAQPDEIAGLTSARRDLRSPSALPTWCARRSCSSEAPSSSRSLRCPVVRNSIDTVRRFGLRGAFQQPGDAFTQ